MTDTTTPPVLDDNGAAIIGPTLHHTGNQTARMDEMVHWYRNVLGQAETLSGVPPQTIFPSVWTSNDDAHHRMGFLKVPGVEATEFSATTPGVQHTAWEYPSLDALLESWQRIAKLGITPLFCVNHGVSYAFYYKDPDGNLVELLCDAFGDHAKSKHVILTNEVIRNNPAGIPLDPALLLQGRQAGLSIEELHQRSYAGEYAPEGAKNHHLPDDQAYVVDSDT